MQNNNKSYKIVIIEPSMIISTGLRKLIEMKNEFEVVAVIADCFHCLERIYHLNPDIIISFSNSEFNCNSGGKIMV